MTDDKRPSRTKCEGQRHVFPGPRSLVQPSTCKCRAFTYEAGILTEHVKRAGYDEAMGEVSKWARQALGEGSL